MTKHYNSNKALYDAKKILAQIVTDVVNLEDINYTVPEVQTLLDGITVGGHKIQDELITVNQIKAWKFLFISIEEGTFSVNKNFILQLHAIVANQEALTWGEFRTGNVNISGTSYTPPNASKLNELWGELELEIETILSFNNLNDSVLNIDRVTNTYSAAINLFAKMARSQFFFDGNKRTARMMMSGVLLSHGYPMINVPAARKLEFNQVMINYYNTQQWQIVYSFLISCIHKSIIEEYNLQILTNHII
ncbi:MAG: Fic family protein [Burkholderiales bacterium]|nr:Fic family protein [Burkholderiales bacterium]